MKNNGVNLTGITLTSDNSNIAPTVYIDSCYERYINGEIYAQIMNELISTLEEHIIQDNMNMDFFHEYEKVRKNIVMKLINKERIYGESGEQYLPGSSLDPLPDAGEVHRTERRSTGHRTGSPAKTENNAQGQPTVGRVIRGYISSMEYGASFL